MGFLDTLSSTWECLKSGQMDYVGQENARNTMNMIIYATTTLGFFHGWYEGRFAVTFRWSFAGYILANLVCFLSWPMWNQNPVKWQTGNHELQPPTKGPAAKKKKKES